jgi:L-asparaginase II
MPIVTSSHSGRPADVQLVALLKSAEQELETLTAARPAAKEQQHDRQQATGPDEGTEQLVRSSQAR